MKKILAILAITIAPTLFASTGIGIDSLLADHLANRGILKKQISLELYNTRANITRAELVGIALKIKKVQLPENYVCKKYFSDVTKNDWICRAVELAADAGLITRKNKNFRPQDNILNIEAMSILHKASGLTGNKPSQAMSDFISNEVKIGWHKETLYAIDKSGIVFDVYPVANIGYPIVDIRRGEVFGFINNILNIQDSKKGITVPLISFGESYYDRKLSLKINGTIKNIDECCLIQNPFIKNNVLFYDWTSTGGSHIRIYDIKNANTTWIDQGKISPDGKIVYNCYRENGYSIYSLEKNRRIERYRNVKPLSPENDGMIISEFCHYKKDNGGTLIYEDGTKYSLSKELQDPINVLDTYYSLLGSPRNHDLLYAYNMRKGSTVSYDTFSSWYSDGTGRFEIDTKSIKNLGDNTYEFIVIQKQEKYDENYKVQSSIDRFRVKSKIDVENFTIENISSVKI